MIKLVGGFVATQLTLANAWQFRRGPMDFDVQIQKFFSAHSNGTSSLGAHSNGISSQLDEATAAAPAASPALQPAAVYDKDFPVDMAQKTPQELRYQAQADYARAIQRLKAEAQEAEVARQEMEKQLKVLEDAKAAALQAEKEAAKAKAEAAALKAAASKEGAEAAAEKKEADNAKSAVSKEQSEYDGAKKAYTDAQAAEKAAQDKIAALKKKSADLCAEIKKLEGEQGVAIQSFEGAKQGASAKEAQKLKAEAEVNGATGIAAAEQKEAAQAELEAAQAKDRLTKAEAAAKAAQDPAELDALVVKEKKEYEDALENFKKEENDVKASQLRVAQAKAELAKWESHSGAHCVSSLLLPIIVALLVFAY